MKSTSGARSRADKRTRPASAGRPTPRAAATRAGPARTPAATPAEATSVPRAGTAASGASAPDRAERGRVRGTARSAARAKGGGVVRVAQTLPVGSGATARAARPTGREGLRQMMSGNAARRLGIELVSAGPRRIVARIAVRPEHLNRGERVNGGVLMAFADLLGAAGTVLNLPAGHRTTTLESKTNFFAAGQGPAITATSIPLHIGRSTSVWQTRIENEDGRLVAIVTQTQIILPPSTAAAS